MSFVLGQAEVIECWDQAFTKIPIGEKATVECPASMAYGEVMKPGIPENSDLTFDVELLSCDKDELADIDVNEMQTLAAETETASKTGGEQTIDEAIAAADPTPDPVM